MRNLCTNNVRELQLNVETVTKLFFFRLPTKKMPIINNNVNAEKHEKLAKSQQNETKYGAAEIHNDM